MHANTTVVVQKSERLFHVNGQNFSTLDEAILFLIPMFKQQIAAISIKLLGESEINFIVSHI